MKCTVYLLAGVLAAGIVVGGCNSNPTNAPSKAAVEEADKKRAAAIDNDPTLTPEQKEMQKRMLGLLPGGRGPGGGK